MFKLAVSDNFCTGRDSILVIVQDLPTASLGQDVQIEIGGFVQLQSNATANVSWSPNNGLSCDDCPDPIASPVISTTYIITVTDSLGCQSFDTLDVVVLESVVNLPKAFSPNMDGINDIIFAEGMYVSEFNLKIYNRWGQIVFETNDMALGWNGEYMGQEQPVGTYVYVITGTLYQKPYIKQGNISLMR
jgi:gliding motility-associated-like protein